GRFTVVVRAAPVNGVVELPPPVTVTWYVAPAGHVPCVHETPYGIVGPAPPLMADFATKWVWTGPGVPVTGDPEMTAAIWLWVSAVSNTRNRDIDPLKNASASSFVPVPPGACPRRCLAPTTRFSSMPVMVAPVFSVPVWAMLLRAGEDDRRVPLRVGRGGRVPDRLGAGGPHPAGAVVPVSRPIRHGRSGDVAEVEIDDVAGRERGRGGACRLRLRRAGRHDQPQTGSDQRGDSS